MDWHLKEKKQIYLLISRQFIFKLYFLQIYYKSFNLQYQIYFIHKTVSMDSILMSRMKKDTSPTKLNNLSPEKYGKAAWAELTYTPSKLADNVIYRQATTLRKNQEGTNKLREFQTLNGHMKQRLIQLQLQRDGIELSLNQQLSMYKKMLHDSEVKHEQRLKEMQKRFSSQISVLIEQKQEEGKFAQAQKEVLEGRIQELQHMLREIEQRQSNLQGQHGGLRNEYQKLRMENSHLQQRLSISEKERVMEQEESRRREDDIQTRLVQTESKMQNRIQTLIIDKNKERESLERVMKNQLEKSENLRMNDGVKKTQELREIMQTFESETKRLNDIIGLKDRMLQSLTIQNTKTKQNLLQLTASYENQLNSVIIDRNRLGDQVQKNRDQISHLRMLLDNQMTARQDQRLKLGGCLGQLKQELHLNQVNYVRQRDRFSYWGADVEKQLLFLREQNIQLKNLIAQNQQMGIQIRNLRDLLVQSSFEIERCKQELMRMSFERDNLATKAQKTYLENERLHRLNRDIEEQAFKFRNTLYNQRTIFR